MATSVGSRGDSYDNALAESVIGLYKTELVHRRGPWRVYEVAGVTPTPINAVVNRGVSRILPPAPQVERTASPRAQAQRACNRSPIQ